jgi:hypothetical protein
MRKPSDQASQEFATRHLEKFGVGMSDLLPLVGELEGAEAVLLTGSVAEGLANPDSDIDLMVIGQPLEARDGVTTTGRNCQVVNALGQPCGFDIQITVFTPETACTVLDRFAEFVRTWDQKLAAFVGGGDVDATPWAFPWFAPTERLFLHRLRTGIPLAGSETVSRLRSDGGLERLPLQTFFTAVHACYGFLEDAIAQADQPDGDHDTACVMLTLAADATAEFLLAGAGETHPYAKWRPKLLRRHREEIGPDSDTVLDFLLAGRDGNPGQRALDMYRFAGEAVERTGAKLGATGTLARIYVRRLRLRDA